MCIRAEIKTNQNTAAVSDDKLKSQNFYTVQKMHNGDTMKWIKYNLGEEGIESLCWLKVGEADTTKGIVQRKSLQ